MSGWTLGRGRFAAVPGPVLVVVMDGVGLGADDEGNAFRLARTPVLDDLLARSCVPLAAHGTAVGLPSDADMGNSEVGHNALGSGRVVSQGASLVNDAVESGRLFRGETWRWLVEGVKASGEPLHFVGLLSDGNVHSHDSHLHAMLRHAAEEGVPRARVHILLDGRDVGETSALEYVDRLETVLAEIRADGRHDYRIASGGGRMKVTMDRYEADWGMVEEGWKLHVLGEGRRFASATEAIETFRDEQHGVTDQYLPGFVIADAGGPVGPIEDGAGVVLFNFRGDRAIELTRAFEAEDFKPFDRKRWPQVRFAGMMEYDHELYLPKHYLVDPPTIQKTLGEYLSRNGVTQFACSETQKFGHVTYFWNGNRSGRFDDKLETYAEVPSDRVPFEQRPWMKAAEIVDATLAGLATGKYRHARINLANGDMVGHTGKLLPTIVAMEAMDLVIGRLLDGVARMDGVVLVTADHGNAEEMFEHGKDGRILQKNGRPVVRTSHSLNPVPCSLYDPRGRVHLAATVQRPGLANVAATVIELLGFAPPEGYEPSLLAPK